MMYQLWLARNEARDGAMIEGPKSVARKTISPTEEWHQVHAKLQAVPIPRPRERWCPSGDGMCKINTDGSFSSSEKCGGGGAVVRSHDGAFVAGASHFFPNVIDPEGAEVLACKHAVELAKEVGCRKFELELDCTNVVKKLKEDVRDRSVHGPLIEELKLAIRDFHQVKISVVCRTDTDNLAKVGCGNKLCETWFSQAAVVAELADDLCDDV
jgi:ribonuclease HI